MHAALLQLRDHLPIVILTEEPADTHRYLFADARQELR
jgi:hypothetical protein